MHIAVLILLLRFLQTSLAVHADEAYQLDLHLPLLGIPLQHATFFHRPSTSSTASLLYTLTDNGILGAVNPKDGSLLWRRSIGLDGRGDLSKGLLKSGLGSDIIASVLDDRLRVFDAIDGRLKWEWQSTGRVKSVVVLSDLDVPAIALLEHVEGGAVVVRYLTADSGSQQWQFKDTSGDIGHTLMYANNSLFYVALHPSLLKGYKIKIKKVNTLDGRETGQACLFNSDSEVSSEVSILYAGFIANLPVVIWADSSLKTVKLGSIAHSHTVTLPLNLEDGFNAANATVVAPTNIQSDPDFLLQLQTEGKSTGRIYRLDPSTGRLSNTHRLRTIVGQGIFSASSHGSAVYFLLHSSQETSLIVSSSAAILQTWPLRSKSIGFADAENGINYAVAEIAPKGDSRFSVRYAQALESGDWEMIVNGESTWVRNEGIAGVVAAAFADPAADETFADDLAVEGRSNTLYACYHRLKRHFRDLHSLLPQLLSRFNHFVGFTSQEPRKAATQGNRFGFDKLVVVLTKHGRVSALDMGKNGRILWNTRVPSPAQSDFRTKATVKILDATAAIKIGRDEDIHIDIASGRILPVDNEKNTRSDQWDLRPLPGGGQSEASFLTSRYLSPGIPRGRSLVVAKAENGQKLTAWLLLPQNERNPAWEFSPPLNEEITTILHRSASDRVASIGRVLGDRNVLYKFIDPNILLVVCQNSQANKVSFLVLDAASGTIIYSTTRSDVDLKQPITASLSENTLAYSLFSKADEITPREESQGLTGFQLTVADLYESPLPNDRGARDMADQSLRRARNSSIQEGSNLPHVISQTFLIPEPIEFLTFTSTLQGITPRSLLGVIPHSGSIVSIPRHLLDPRRPVGRDASAAEIEEGLFRFNSILDFDPKWYLNHQRESLGFSKIITSPTLLESTSLVFAFGDLDLFSTRISPIGAFDMLGKGFSKFQLVATVSALAIGTAILGPMVGPPRNLAWRHCKAS